MSGEERVLRRLCKRLCASNRVTREPDPQGAIAHCEGERAFDQVRRRRAHFPPEARGAESSTLACKAHEAARAFGFAHEVDALAARGLASHVAQESVVVITTDGVLSAGPRFRPDEPARHELLDLVGDLDVHGGPSVGSVRAVRPGHAATHEAVRRALAEDLLVVDRTR
jgi:hypothetical protein